MAGLLSRLVFRTRVVTTWVDSLPLRGHGLLLPITAQPGCTCACRRNYRNSPTWLQNNVAATTNGRSNEHELTAEERRLIDELWKSQEPLGAIAKTMNKRLSVVWKLILGSSRGSRPTLEWTDEEHNMLRELRKQGFNARQIAEKLGRSYNKTRGYLELTRCPSAARHTNVYSLQERNQAVKLLEGGLKPTSIAERLGVPVRIVAHMLRNRVRRHSWTTEDVEKVLALKEAGSSWQEIQAVLSGPSESAIRSLYSHLTLARHCPRPSSAKSAKVPWSPEEDAKLLKLRNVQRLKFIQITQQMPGRSLWALESRYRNIDASLKGNAGYTLQELEEIIRLRTARASWQDVVARFPYRTVQALRTVFHKTCCGKYSVDAGGNIIWHEIPSHWTESGSYNRA